MHYGELKKCDIANGIGVRVTLFVSGCTNHCPDCFQPQTWDFGYGKEFTEDTKAEIFAELDKPFVNGLTVLGGALYHLIFEAKAQYAYPYMVYMLPLAAAGLCRLEDGAARLICSGKKWVQRRAECARTSHRD